MSKILFILGMYEPNPSANGICCEEVINKLVEKGDNVTCVVNGVINKSKYEVYNGVDIYRIKPRLTYRLNEWCKYNKLNRNIKFIQCISNILSKMKNIIAILTWPLVSPLYAYRFYSLAKKLYLNKKFDVVIAVNTPTESLIAGHLLKKKFNSIKFVPYFLDPLSGGYGPKIFSEKTIIKRGLKWEKRLLKNADTIIAMKSSKEHHERYNKQQQFFNKIKFLDIPLMSKKQYLENNTGFLDKNKINLVYVGSILYPIRNPKYMLEVLKNINMDNIVMTFVGSSNINKVFLEAKKELGHTLKLIDNMPHEKAMSILHEADILVNIGNTNSNMTPSKIFEYMSIGKPIISTYSFDDEPSISYLKKYPAALLLDERKKNDKTQIYEVNQFIKKNKNIKIEFETIKNEFYNNTPESVVNVIEYMLLKLEV